MGLAVHFYSLYPHNTSIFYTADTCKIQKSLLYFLDLLEDAPFSTCFDALSTLAVTKGTVAPPSTPVTVQGPMFTPP